MVKEEVEPHLCLSDFVAPVESGKRDYIGMFVVSAGFGCSELAEKYVEILFPRSYNLCFSVSKYHSV